MSSKKRKQENEAEEEEEEEEEEEKEGQKEGEQNITETMVDKATTPLVYLYIDLI